ncbi:GIY-YIG nuclease family protein [Nostoc sp. FACHB-190]|uniref:GIY-YIG nuclease family protein n=1 Tax=Nostoc sp. FACHB-190 TaxID=2692838 RepID=UPI0016876320|nr:GIY-YIG nuclease family protein [Nostoc sp. FACHB-190]MBD2303152.1 GIY-YIG nuclease family protein [Nostoc sp. FACHB-190]
MNADEYILKLPNIALRSRELLPEQPGIYYVVDESNVIWYVGQAKNLHNRWLGDNHHRLDQFKRQRNRRFTIYYELVNESNLDIIEKQRIGHYHPQLNGTEVNSKKLHPTETLLRKTLITIAPYGFILGVEPPRKDDIKLIEYSKYYRDIWRINKSVLPLSVIHICINLTELLKLSQDISTTIRFLKKVFSKSINSSGNWNCQGSKRSYRLSDFLLRRLLVNGFAIEVYVVRQEVTSYIQNYTMTQLAGIHIKAISSDSLNILQEKCLQNNIAGLYLKDNISHQYLYTDLCHRAINRLKPYTEDLVKVLFNESIDKSKLLKFPPHKNEAAINLGLSVRLLNLIKRKEYLKEILIEQGFDLSKYQVDKYLEDIPKDNNYYESHLNKNMTVYVKSFLYGDLRQSIYSSSMIYGKKGAFYQNANLPYIDVYLAFHVNRAFWLLFENYLCDFAKVSLSETEGYLKKYYSNPTPIVRKYVDKNPCFISI